MAHGSRLAWKQERKTWIRDQGSCIRRGKVAGVELASKSRGLHNETKGCGVLPQIPGSAVQPSARLQTDCHVFLVSTIDDLELLAVEKRLLVSGDFASQRRCFRSHSCRSSECVMRQHRIQCNNEVAEGFGGGGRGSRVPPAVQGLDPLYPLAPPQQYIHPLTSPAPNLDYTVDSLPENVRVRSYRTRNDQQHLRRSRIRMSVPESRNSKYHSSSPELAFVPNLSPSSSRKTRRKTQDY